MSNNKKIKVYTEGVFTTLIKLLSGGKFRKELRKLEKMTKDDKDLQATLDSLAHHNDELKRKLANFCKRNPNDDLCKDGGYKKYSTIEVHY